MKVGFNVNALKTVVQKWKDMNAILRILIGLVIGLALGLLFPNMPVIGLLGSIFVGSLKGIAPILVFVLIMSSLANSSTGIGARFRTVIFLYMVSTFVASIVAVFTSYLFPVTMKLTGEAADQAAPAGVGEVWTNLLNNMVTNPVSALANANYIGILFWAVLFGLALKAIGSEKTNTIIAEIADMINKVVTWIILLAPFGVMGLVFNAVSENGLAIFTVYGKLVASLVGSMLFVTLVTDPFIASLFLKRNPYPLTWTALKESGLTAFFTRSSAANIPVNMATCEKLGLEKDFYSVSIPLGATINMDGAAAVITIMSLSVAKTMGIEVSIPTAIALSFLSTLAACGASGVAGGSLLLIPMACSFFGISNDIAMQAVEVGFIIGVIQDSVETALNSSGDVVFSATAEYYARRKKGEDMRFLGDYAKKKKDAPAEG